MTNEVAIEILKTFVDNEEVADGDEVVIYDDDLEAMDIAIESLENQESEKERIIKELEEATVIGANDFGQFECIPKWEAIEIVRGGKE